MLFNSFRQRKANINDAKRIVTTQPLNIVVYQDVMQKHKNISKNISY